uniref:Rhodanese domain-containing protein n=1 Tax=viral metagenome TaxID=1070528 RepID=A0A6C0B736_9ZZZZ
MGNTTQATANYDDIRHSQCILIHIMEDESILIERTILIEKETIKINSLLAENNYDTHIIVYGKNVDDYELLVQKRNQLLKLGFRNVWFYPGGLFEWILLRDVFGTRQFSTTADAKDLIKYRPKSGFNNTN